MLNWLRLILPASVGLLVLVACGEPEASEPPAPVPSPPVRVTARLPDAPTTTPSPTVTSEAIATPTPEAIATPTQLSMALRVQDGQGAIGDAIPIELSLHNATKSIAGFQVTVSVQNRGIARIADVKFADYGDPKTGFELTEVMDELPAQHVTIAAVDLRGVLKVLSRVGCSPP